MKLRSLLLLFAIATLSFSQNGPTSSLSGSVADPSGAVLSGAALELINTATHLSRHANSDSQGRFLFNLIPPGVYDLTVSATGFQTVTHQGIVLDVDLPGTIHVTLPVSGATQQITVTAEAPMVDSESGTLRQVVSEKYIQELPLNGRNAATLVFMAPGTVVGKGTDTATYATTSDTIAVS